MGGLFWCAGYDRAAAAAERNGTGPRPWLIYDPCDTELFNVIAFGFALYANTLIFIYAKCVSTK